MSIKNLGYKLWIRKTRQQSFSFINRIFPTPKSYFEVAATIATIWLAITANDLAIQGNKLAENDSLQQESIQQLKKIAIAMHEQTKFLQKEIEQLSLLEQNSNRQNTRLEKQFQLNKKSFEIQSLENTGLLKREFKKFKLSLDSARTYLFICGMIDSNHIRYFKSTEDLILLTERKMMQESDNLFYFMMMNF